MAVAVCPGSLHNRHIPPQFVINEHLMFGLVPSAFKAFLRSSGQLPDSYRDKMVKFSTLKNTNIQPEAEY